MKAAPPKGYTREVETAAWAVQNGVVIVAWNCPSVSRGPTASLIVNGQTVPMTTSVIDGAGAKEGPAPVPSIIVSKARRSPRATWTKGSLEIRVGGELVGTSAVRVTPSIDDFRWLVAEGLHDASREARAQVVEAIALALLTGVDSSTVVEIGEQLRLIRKALRQRLPEGVVGRDSPRALVIDALSVIDDQSFYVQGWMHDAEADITRLVATSPEGIRTEVLPLASLFARPDVDQVYGTEDDDSASRPMAFSCFFETRFPSRRRKGWIFEIHDAAGKSIQAKPMLIADDDEDVRYRILSDFIYESSAPGLITQQVHPAMVRLQEQHQDVGEIAAVESFGPLAESPDVSIVIPLYKRIDFVEHQVTQFAQDPELLNADLIFVLDSPRKANRLRKEAAELFALYGVPFRIAILEKNSGFAAATDAGASLARGRLLLLLNSDVLPDRPGWLGAMVRFYDGQPDIGALGSKLLYEDEGLQHAGMYFLRFPGSDVWTNMHYFKGLHRSHPPANKTRAVPAVTGACLMVSRDRYDKVGGLSRTYVQGDFEDSDLCLRLIAAGYENWYLAEVELYHLEGQSYPSPVRELTQRYNSWMHTSLWNDRIETIMARYEGAEHEVRSRPGGGRARTATESAARVSASESHEIQPGDEPSVGGTANGTPAVEASVESIDHGEPGGEVRQRLQPGWDKDRESVPVHQAGR